MHDDSDFSVDGLPVDQLIGLDPTPDEDAWEAYLLFAMEQIGGEESNAIEMQSLRALEKSIGVQLPFEVGLLLVIGVPDSDEWYRWGSDPSTQYAEWKERTVQSILGDVETKEFWAPAWGPRPDSADARESVVRAEHAMSAPLLPLFNDRVVPLTAADGEATAESNPVLAIEGAFVTTAGTDIAAWLTNEFDVPLPMWPETAARSFPFWSDLADPLSE